jgi:hypothetical protein
MFAKGELYWDDGESIINNVDDHNWYHFEFEFLVDKVKAELVINRKRQAVSISQSIK